MQWPGEIWRRLLFLFRRGQLDRDLEDEMQFHVEMKARQNRQAGMDAEEARYAARRQFGSDPAALGKHIRINRHDFTVIGVAPKGFAGLPAGSGVARAEFWVPVSAVGEILPEFGGVYLLHHWGNHWIFATGRLKPGLDVAQAELALRPVSDQLREQWSRVWGGMRSWRDNPSGWTAALVPASENRIAHRYRRSVTGFLSMLLAVVLAAVGIYGVVSFAVAQRTRELGLRMALGADAAGVLRLVLGRSLGLVLAGIAIGLALALALTRFVSSLLYGVSATDPLTFAGSSVLLAVVALVAGYLPARRATRIDPMEALRYE